MFIIFVFFGGAFDICSGCPPECLHGLYDFSYVFYEQADFLQLCVPVFGSTIYSILCDNVDAVVKVKTELVALNRRIMFCFSATVLCPDKLFVLRCSFDPRVRRHRLQEENS